MEAASGTPQDDASKVLGDTPIDARVAHAIEVEKRKWRAADDARHEAEMKRVKYWSRYMVTLAGIGSVFGFLGMVAGWAVSVVRPSWPRVDVGTGAFFTSAFFGYVWLERRAGRDPFHFEPPAAAVPEPADAAPAS